MSNHLTTETTTTSEHPVNAGEKKPRRRFIGRAAAAQRSTDSKTNTAIEDLSLVKCKRTMVFA
jgi:hypothetical protein